jgi:hypothetical protein
MHLLRDLDILEVDERSSGRMGLSNGYLRHGKRGGEKKPHLNNEPEVMNGFANGHVVHNGHHRNGHRSSGNKHHGSENGVCSMVGIDSSKTNVNYRCEDGRFTVFASCVTISNPDLLSRSETCVNPGIRS